MTQERIYPAGVQTFSDIIEQGMVYVDKTDLMYRMVKKYKYVFLGRPRRFGKSLLSSTLHAYFDGQKDLFKGLAIENLEKGWTAYPVLHFDMSVLKNCSVDRLPQKFNNLLKDYEEALGIDNSTETPGDRLSEIIKLHYKQTEVQGYMIPYSADGRKPYKIGASFSTKTRTIEDWIYETHE